MSPVVEATTQESRPAAIAAAADAVRAGQVVVFPTDTVYGVGCDAFNAVAVKAMLAAKGRGPEMPPPVLIHDVATLDGLAADVAPYVRDLVEHFWPGPLTVIVAAQPSLQWDLGETRGTVALRVPDDPIARALLKEIGPMAVTSANRTGQAAATTVLDAATQLGALISVYVDGGPRGVRPASTIIDCTGAVPVLVRAGAISAAALADFLPAQTQSVDGPADELAEGGDDPSAEHLADALAEGADDPSVEAPADELAEGGDDPSAEHLADELAKGADDKS